MNGRKGYGAFSYSHSQIDDVYRYIKNQEEHHSKVNFKEEYLNNLEKLEIPYDERYVFEDLKLKEHTPVKKKLAHDP